MEVILEAGKIPVNSRVKKPGGKLEYILKDSIHIFGHLDQPGMETLKPDGGGSCRFILNEDHINLVNCECKLVWVVEETELLKYLERRVDNGEV